MSSSGGSTLATQRKPTRTAETNDRERVRETHRDGALAGQPAPTVVTGTAISRPFQAVVVLTALMPGQSAAVMNSVGC
jgi:hypothetical protein